MKIHEVASLCGVHAGTIRRWIKERGFPEGKALWNPSVKRGRLAQEWSANEVAQWLQRNGAYERAKEAKCRK